jgi:preprotein translocase subunit SecF
MHLERIVITRVSAIVVAAVVAIVGTTVVAIVAAVVVAAVVGAFGSVLLGYLLIIQIIIVSSGGRPRARDTIIGIVAPP